MHSFGTTRRAQAQPHLSTGTGGHQYDVLCSHAFAVSCRTRPCGPCPRAIFASPPGRHLRLKMAYSSGQEVRATHQTTGKPVWTTSDCSQIISLSPISSPDYILQDDFYIIGGVQDFDSISARFSILGEASSAPETKSIHYDHKTRSDAHCRHRACAAAGQKAGG